MSNKTIDQVATVFPVNAEALKPDPKFQSSLSIIKDFSLNTSAHGISGIARSQSMPNRIFWSIASLIFLGVMLYFIISAILTYLTYPTQTSMDVVQRWPLAFPAVTFCNYSPLRYDRFIGPFLNYTNAMNWTNTTDTSSFSPEQAAYVGPFALDMVARNADLNSILFPLDAMLISCTYNYMPCTAANFTSFRSLKYGACYTFNGKSKNLPGGGVRDNAENGDTGNLQLELYVHRHQYIPYTAKATGILAMVHENDRLPIVSMRAMYFGTGRRHKLSHRQKEFTFLPAPYTRCTMHVNPPMQALFNQYPETDYTYSIAVCFDVCVQAYIYDRCGCVRLFTWNIHTVMPYGTDQLVNASHCEASSLCPYTAAREFTTNSSIFDLYCADCQQECEFVEFVVQTTSLTAMLDYDLDRLKYFVNNSNIPPPENWSDIWQTEIPANYVSLEVVTETSIVEVYTQQATTSPVDLLSNIGGQTGLWIGISFLSLLEVTEMLFRIIRTKCHTAARKTRKRTKKRQLVEAL